MSQKSNTSKSAPVVSSSSSTSTTSSESDELFEVRNNFYLGSFQAAINEASALSRLSTDSLTVERDCFIYRSWIALGNYQLVLDEIPDSAPASLQVVKLLANYMKDEKLHDICFETLKQWLADEEYANNQMLQLIAGLIYFQEGNLDESYRSVIRSNSLEGRALVVQIYLKLNLPDHAEKELKTMQDMDDDATLTQLVSAWINLALGGEKIQDASYIFQELSEKHSSTPLLLNGLAACNMLLQKYTEAERFLLEALEKNPKDPETLINLIGCLTIQGKPNSRYLNQVRTNLKSHPWATQLSRVEELFSLHANRFAL